MRLRNGLRIKFVEMVRRASNKENNHEFKRNKKQNNKDRRSVYRLDAGGRFGGGYGGR